MENNTGVGDGSTGIVVGGTVGVSGNGVLVGGNGLAPLSVAPALAGVSVGGVVVGGKTVGCGEDREPNHTARAIHNPRNNIPAAPNPIQATFEVKSDRDFAGNE